MWFVLSLVCAFLTATSDALSKKALEKNNIYFISWIRLIFCIPFLLPLLIATGLPKLDGYYFTSVILGLPIEILALLLYMRSIQISPLSLTIPFLALTPVFLIPTSYLMLGEKTGLSGIAGIMLIAGGAYVLNISHLKTGFFEPFRRITKDKGVMMMVCVAFLYSITSNFGKMGITHSSPMFFGCTYFMLQPILLIPFIKTNKSNIFNEIKSGILILTLTGFVYTASIITHFAALSMVEVAYMISVKRSNLIFSVLYGAVFFGEKGLAQRMTGSIIMLAGIIILAFAK
ncbi:MAG: EamA family transporter [Candidatus Schekmanbacteria bacterium]|nr:EamA family transporter [Candidatus Schekmanbacteria bacterium]